jgi:apolipoprotein N-acyltransferase
VQGSRWLAVVAGAIFPLGLAPFDYGWLSLVVVGVLFRLLDDVPPRRAAFIGWAFGVGKYGVGASWIYVSIHDYGPAPVWLAASLVAFFVVAMALFPAAFTYFYARFVRGRNAYMNALGFSSCWVLLEWILTWFLTGFPWLFLGYAQLDNPLRHWAPVGGVLFVSLLAAASVTLIVCAAAPQPPVRRAIVIAFAVLPWLLGVGLGQVRWVEPGVAGTVALVQGNF